jgi:hypothetical protein
MNNNEWPIAFTHWMMQYPGEQFDLTEREIARTMVHYIRETVSTVAVFVFAWAVFQII